MTLLGVALAGALGAPARFLVERAISARTGGRFPWGTWVVNVSGAFALGFLTGLVLYHGVDPDARIVLGTGFLGAYTTFSAFALETVDLTVGATPGGRRRALSYALGSIALGVLAAAAGLGLAGL